MSTKDTHYKNYPGLQQQLKLVWPKHLSEPGELLHALRNKTQLRLVKSPLCSKIVLQFIGSWSYFLAHFMNKTRVYNEDVFRKELKLDSTKDVKVRKTPLVTLSNHISCIDDPVLWACLLPFSYYSTRTDSVRWAAAAVDICFSKPWHSTFFSLGKTFPLVRGVGVDQPAMDFALGLLEHNQWLHMFPEGRVMRDANQKKISNEDRGYIFKWGIAKLILDYFKDQSIMMSASLRRETCDSEKKLRILPFYHLGMDEVLPIGRPYIPRACKKITILLRPSVIELDSRLLGNIIRNRSLSVQKTTKSRSNDEITRIKLTNYLEEELEKLSESAMKLHKL